jgi:EpsI family protein
MRTRVLIVTGLLLAAAAAVTAANRPERPVARTSFAEFPAEIGEWSLFKGEELSADVLKILGADDYLVRLYSAPAPDKALVGLYIGYWNSQRQGDTMHSPLNCLPGAGWEPVSQSMIPLPVPGNPGAKGPLANRYIVEQGLLRQYVLYWYQSRGRVVASEYWNKFYLIGDAVRLNRTDGAIVRITTDIKEAGEAAAERQVLRFAEILIPLLPTYLPN